MTNEVLSAPLQPRYDTFSVALSDKTLEKIMPLRIGNKDESDLPSLRPMLHVLFPLNRGADIVVRLEVNQAFQSVSFCESFDGTFSMLGDTANEIGCHPDIKDAIRFVGENVDASSHRPMFASGDHRDKPGDDSNR